MKLEHVAKGLIAAALVGAGSLIPEAHNYLYPPNVIEHRAHVNPAHLAFQRGMVEKEIAAAYAKGLRECGR